MNDSPLEIRLLDKSYKVNCHPDEREGLVLAADFLTARVTEIANHTHATGERLAVMVALNFAHEIVVQRRKNSDEDIGRWTERIRTLNSLVQNTLTNKLSSTSP